MSKNNQERIIQLTQLSFYYKSISVFTICYMFQPKSSTSGKNYIIYDDFLGWNIPNFKNW